MARLVKTLVNGLSLPDGNWYPINSTVSLTDGEFALLDPIVFTSGKLQDLGHDLVAEAPVYNPSPVDDGLLGWAYDPVSAAATISAITGQIVRTRVKVPVGGLCRNILCEIKAAGVGLTAGQNLAAVYDSSGNQMGITADQSTAWATTGQKIMPLVTPVQLPPGTYFVCLLSVFATTAPGWSRSGAVSTANYGTAAQLRFAIQANSGQTTLPPTINLASAGVSGQVMTWVGLN